MRWPRSLAALHLVVALSGLPACLPTQSMVAVHHVEVRGVGLGGVDMVMFLEVTNRTPIDVTVRNVNCSAVFGSGRTLGPIQVTPNLPLRSGQTAIIQAPVSIPLALAPGLAAEPGGAVIRFRLVGDAAIIKSNGSVIGYHIDQDAAIPRDVVTNAQRRAFPIPFIGG
jgi:hypothetical protein